MTSIYLLRHGEYQNKRKILPVRLPGFPLNQEGKEQTRKIATYLQNKKISIIYSSPLLRCKQSAQIIGKILKIKSKYPRQILEVKAPLYQGMKLKDFWPPSQDVYSDPLHRDNAYKNPKHLQNGESIKQVFNRMKNLIDKILKKHLDENILLISHGDPIMILIYGTVDKDPEKYLQKLRIYIPKGGLAKLTFSGKNFRSFRQINY